MRNRIPEGLRPPLIAVALALAAVASPAVIPTTLHAQEEPATEAALDSLRAEIERLKEQIDSLRAAIARGEPGAEEEEEDVLARLREAAEAAAREEAGEGESEEEGGQFVGRQRSLQQLNPEISVTGDIFSFYEPDLPDENNFIPREFEVSFQSALDPFSRAKIFVAHHEEGGGLEPFEGHEGGHAHGAAEEGGGSIVAVEEAYLEWVSLPGGFGLTLGRIRQRLGTYNRWHRHALPWQQLPLPYLAFVGEEGLAQSGASVQWLLPVGGSAGTYEIWLQGTKSENGAMFADSNEPSFLGHFNAFWDLSPSTYLELGLSGLTGTHIDEEEGEEFTNSLYHVEAALNWRPPQRAMYRELTLRGALLFNDRSIDIAGVDTDAFGGYVHGEFRFGRQWLAGLRYDFVENPTDPAEDAWALVPTLTWWQSEWVRLRAEYDHLERPGGDAFRQLLLQVTFAMGPHKHETY